MTRRLNIKKVIIVIVALIVLIVIVSLIINGIRTSTINKQMKNAVNAITIKDEVNLYSSKRQSRKIGTLDIGTNAYILENVTDKNGNKLCKVKTGEKVGYILAEDLKYYEKANMKKELMLDVSQFNLKNNFSSIGEFKAFILNNNIKYVYIRAGGRGYGKAGNFYKDTNYKDYADACEYLKVPFGFYFLEEAITSEEVDEEVTFVKEFLKDNKYKYNELPVALDIEKHLETGRADEIWDTRYLLVNELTEKLESKNIDTIVYSNANIANKYLTNVNTELWLAYYPIITEIPDYWYSDTQTEGASNNDLISKMVAWQFTETGIPNSINKDVDISIVYSNYFSTGSMDDLYKDISDWNSSILKIMDLEGKNTN